MILPASRLIPVAPTLDAYVMDPTPFNWGPMLAPFSPPLPREGQIVLASYFGDVFVEDKHGAVWWLNGMEERVDRIAISNDQFLERVSREHLTMLKTKLMESLIVGDKLAKAGTIYGLMTPRSEGGKYHPDNIGAAPIADAFAYMAELFTKKNAPPAPPKGPEAAPAKQKSGIWGKKK
jgi:hypothetical protein